MSYEVQKYYNSLDARWKARFDDTYREHPEWDDSQRVSFIEMVKTIEIGFNTDPTLPPSNFLQVILNKVANFLQNQFPGIYRSVSAKIAEISRKISQYAHAAWDKFKEILDDIFN